MVEHNSSGNLHLMLNLSPIESVMRLYCEKRALIPSGAGSNTDHTDSVQITKSDQLKDFLNTLSLCRSQTPEYVNSIKTTSFTNTDIET